MKSLFFVLFLVNAPATFGDTTTAPAGVVGASGQLASVAGAKGAAVNREVSDQLYSKALNYEKQAWSSFPPNVGLLTKSFALGRDAAAAESQSKDLARAGLSGVSSGAQSGDINQLGLQLVGTDKMKEWATTSSAGAQEGKARMSKYEKYGIHFDHDSMKLKTPAGDIDVSKEALAEGGQIAKIAGFFGYDPADVKTALQESLAERDAVVKSATAQVEAQLAEKEAALKAKGENNPTVAGTGEETKSREIAGLSSGEEDGNGPAADGASLNADGTPNEGDAAAPAVPLAENELDAVKMREDVLNANLNLVRRQMGMSDVKSTDPIGKPEEDIFKMVHQRYLVVEQNGRFLN